MIIFQDERDNSEKSIHFQKFVFIQNLLKKTYVMFGQL
jgi:hypothetical protein